jgi:acetyltransferase-like isoleucine patch superfamily enzyme
MQILPIRRWPDRLPSFVDRKLREVVLAPLCGRIVRLSATWWGIDLGKGCKFYGTPILSRSPGSRIDIGDKCVMRSSRRSNLAGIDRPCYISTLCSGAHIQIGKHCGFSGTVVAGAQDICIGNYVMCGANTVVTDTDWHSLDPHARLLGAAGRSAPVVLEDNVWLGMNVIVLKGVTIGRNTVIGAGSIVSSSIPPNVIAAGQPARIIKSLEAGHTSAPF